MAEHVKEVCDRELWDEEWFIRGITKNGRKIEPAGDEEGKVHLESKCMGCSFRRGQPEKGKAGYGQRG